MSYFLKTRGLNILELKKNKNKDRAKPYQEAKMREQISALLLIMDNGRLSDFMHFARRNQVLDVSELQDAATTE